MSDQGFEGAPASHAEEVDNLAANWLLEKRLAENWSQNDQAALDAWLAEAPENLLAYWRLDEAWARAHRLKALHSPMERPGVSQPARSKPYALGFAAVLTIGAVIGAVWVTQIQPPSVKTYTTPVGGRLTLALSDGSKIELNTNTMVRVSMSAGKRFAELKRGEAFFDIKHDAANPFVVDAGDHRVTDLGTKFLVRNEPSYVRVALYEGGARVETTKSTSGIQATDLTPGDVVTATGSSMSVAKKSVAELKKALGWRKGVLVFDNTTLADAARELNRYNSEKITISDPNVAQLTIGGTFADSDVTALLNTAKQVFGLSVHRNGNEIVISR